MVILHQIANFRPKKRTKLSNCFRLKTSKIKKHIITYRSNSSEKKVVFWHAYLFYVIIVDFFSEMCHNKFFCSLFLQYVFYTYFIMKTIDKPMFHLL